MLTQIPKYCANFTDASPVLTVEAGWSRMKVVVTAGTVTYTYTDTAQFVTLTANMAESEGNSTGGRAGGAAISLTFNTGATGYYKIFY